MQHKLRFSTLIIMILLFGTLFTAPTHAQLSCDMPPPPLNSQDFLDQIANSFWSTTDFCLFGDGVMNEVVSGGVGPDGIPPIDTPRFDPIDVASDWLQPQSPVIAVSLNDEARAYPLAILTRHEIVNDQIGDTPIAVTFCPLCNSAIVYDRRVNGQTYRFGVSGLLRNSDLIMWDDQTKSWWQQFTGEGIVGTHTGTLLDIVSSQVVGFGAFQQQFPDGMVLSTDGGVYGSNGYVGYDSNPTPFLFSGIPDSRLFSVERVLGVLLDNMAVAYPFNVLAQESVVNDTIAGIDVVAFWQPGSVSALDLADIDSSRDVGMAALFNRVLDGQAFTFSAVDGQLVDDQTGSIWNVFGTATSGALAGSQLEQINAFPHLWFSWAAFYPETEIYGFDAAAFAESQVRHDLDPILGDPNAPVTIIEYGAYGCPACKYWHEQGVVEQMLEEFPGQVRFIMRDFPVIVPAYDHMAAELAQCVLDQSNELYWEFHDAMYTIARQGVSTREDLIELARLEGVDVDALRACADAGTHIQTVDYDLNRALEQGFRSSPTFMVNDEILFNIAPDILRSTIQAKLAEAGS